MSMYVLPSFEAMEYRFSQTAIYINRLFACSVSGHSLADVQKNLVVSFGCLSFFAILFVAMNVFGGTIDYPVSDLKSKKPVIRNVAFNWKNNREVVL